MSGLIANKFSLILIDSVKIMYAHIISAKYDYIRGDGTQ